MQCYNNSTHSRDWSGCTRCGLHTTRRSVVIRRSGLVTPNEDVPPEIIETGNSHTVLDLIYKPKIIDLGMIAPFNGTRRFTLLNNLIHEYNLHNIQPKTYPHILLIGEAPGENEDLQGKPFVGEAGRTLNHFFGYSLTTFYFTITNTVACRPPENREPTPAEYNACIDHTTELLESYEFDGIITLGETAHQYSSILSSKLPILKLLHPSFVARQNYKHRELLAIGRSLRQWIRRLTP